VPPVLVQNHAPKTPLNSRSDAEALDNKAAAYFINEEWAKAIPLLEFGLEEYKEDDPYRADNYNHIGKCYLGLKQYAKAVPYYQNALKLYQRWGDTNYNQMPEAVGDYASVLTALGRQQEANAMIKEFKLTKNLKTIP
jgi:tetratricopeptide (TPR) repeat protein